MRQKKIKLLSVLLALCLLISLVLPVHAAIGYGTGDWSNGWGWWSQGQSAYDGVRKYGCLIVAQAKMLAGSGVANQNTAAFNPDVWYEWEVANGYVNSGMYTTSYAGPQAYASAIGKSLTYEGVVYPNGDTSKVWENISAGKFSIIRYYWGSTSDTSHYVLVNNGASSELGRIRVFQSWDSASIPGTRDLEYSIAEVLTYSVGNNPTPGPVAPTNGKVLTDRWGYLPSEAVQITPSGDGMNWYSIRIENPSGETEYSNYTGNLTGTLSFTPKSTGIYTVYVSLCRTWDLFTDANCKFLVANPKAVPEGTYILETALNNNMVLEVAGINSGDNVQIYEKNGTPAQDMEVSLSGNYYYITDRGTQMAIDVSGTSNEYANVWQWTPNQSKAQQWRFFDAGDGYVYIQSAYGLFLDVENGGTSNQTNVWAYQFNGTTAQKWRLVSPCAELGHDFQREIVREPTCTEPGVVRYTCSRCGDSLEGGLEPLGHNYVEGICTRCGVGDPDYQPDNPTPGLPCDGGEGCPGIVFTDMPPKGNWAHDAIDWAIVNKITAGTSATTFSPNAGCTRAQVVTFLWRAAGEPEPETTNNPFEDVKEGTWYYKAVLWAAETGVTAGTSATTFSPDATCTRAQIVTFLWRFEGEPASTTTNNPFSDVKEGAYYEEAVLWASETGVTAGTSATTFSPDATCTRAQVVTFLYRDIEN